MPNNLSLGPGADLDYGLALLRLLNMRGPLGGRVDLVPGIFLTLDSDHAPACEVSSSAGDLVSITSASHLGPVTVSVHLAFGPMNPDVSAVGLVFWLEERRPVHVRAMLRETGTHGAIDIHLPRSAVAEENGQMKVGALDLSGLDRALRSSGEFEVVLVFEAREFDMTLSNLGIFTV